MRIFIALVVASAGLAACTQTSRYVSVPGYAYRTDPNCKRTHPPSKFDERCDCPKLGFSGFTSQVTCGGSR